KTQRPSEGFYHTLCHVILGALLPKASTTSLGFYGSELHPSEKCRRRIDLALSCKIKDSKKFWIVEFKFGSGNMIKALTQMISPSGSQVGRSNANKAKPYVEIAKTLHFALDQVWLLAAVFPEDRSSDPTWGSLELKNIIQGWEELAQLSDDEISERVKNHV